MSEESSGGGRRALIIGGSMAGLLTALLLRRRGWRADVYERATDELASRGAGIATHPPLVAILSAAGVDPGDALGVPITGRTTFAQDGSVAGTHELPQVMTSWDLLYRMLLAPLPAANYHIAMRLVGAEPDSTGVTARFADGTTERGDILIGADGLRSTVRAQMLPEALPLYAGYAAWRGLIPESVVSEPSRRLIDGRLCFCLPPGEQFLTYPVAGENEALEPGRRRINWVWYRSARTEGELATLLTDPDGHRHDISIPPNKMHPDAVAAMRRAAPAALPAHLVELIERTPAPFLQAIYDMESPEIVFGRVLLLGDAAFVARPHTGMGVTKAAEDALALAEALGGPEVDIDAALAAWATPRLRYGRSAVARGCMLGRMLDADRSAPEGDSFGLERGVSAAVMAESGVAKGVQA
ncbi:MAG: FAD-dependent monooxygenase [Alphaproteobacteria bacterium]|jgi:2-polyprenyl-6-methoxyphenol hydroxylase-like FAD-dependent oxidoreductase|nr:FAD-dependent monooxygenase [Alphaproteobacteria bacterium]MDP6517738.1 FAD-dependent monooxygenase [Alphaproteobacteria bacterium]